MTTIYKIHPAIGIARVGDSPDAFFFGPELPGQGPVELDGANETVLQKYKDENGRIKRQGARFRVFAYDQAPDGTLSNPVEVPGTQISWTVHLVNRKAAWGRAFPYRVRATRALSVPNAQSWSSILGRKWWQGPTPGQLLWPVARSKARRSISARC